MPYSLKHDSTASFFTLLSQYVDGVYTQFEFFTLLEDLKKPNDVSADDTFAVLQSMISQRENSRR
jgi:hypothetical protein